MTNFMLFNLPTTNTKSPHTLFRAFRHPAIEFFVDRSYKFHYLPQSYTVHITHRMPDPGNEKASAAGNNPPADLYLPTPSPEDEAMGDDINAPVMTRSLGRKRKAGNLAENRLNRQSPRLNTATNQNEDRVPQLPATHAQPAKAAPTMVKSAPPKKTSGITEEQKAVHEAQEQVRKEAERRSSVWGRIAKPVDDAMEAKAPEQIERQHIDHIVNAILECALPKLAPEKKPSQNHLRKEKKQRARGGP